MADAKISALTALTGAGTDAAVDLLPIVDTSAVTTKKITVAELLLAFGILPSTSGGTGNGFTKFAGPTTAEKTFTLPDASASLAILGANTFTALQTITQASANAGVLASTGYSLTDSGATEMVNLAGTWNTTGNPVALKIAITNTASGTTSKLVSLLAGAAGATEVFSIAKAGQVLIEDQAGGKPGYSFIQAPNTGLSRSANNLVLQAQANADAILVANDCFAVASTIAFAFASTSSAASSRDLLIARDAANVLAQRNSTNAQTLRVYGTYTDASNYERATLSTTAGTGITLAAETAGTGGDNLSIALTPAGTGGVTLGANYQQFTEMTAPAAGAANTARIYAEDNGAGKTRLMAIFPSGVAQQIAIEP